MSDETLFTPQSAASLTHADAARLLDAALAGELPAALEMAVARHLSECSECQAMQRDLAAIRMLLVGLNTSSTITPLPMPSLADSVIAHLDEPSPVISLDEWDDDVVAMPTEIIPPRPLLSSARVSQIEAAQSKRREHGGRTMYMDNEIFPTTPTPTPEVMRRTHQPGRRTFPLIAAALLIVVVVALFFWKQATPTSTVGSSIGPSVSQTPLTRLTATSSATQLAGTLVPVTTIGGDLSKVRIGGVQTRTDGDAWAFGSITDTSVYGKSVILHLVNGKWTINYTGEENSSLDAISMLSPTEGWAAGTVRTGDQKAFTDSSYLLRIVNGKVSRMIPPTGTSPVNMQAFSSDDLWLLAAAGNEGKSIIEHYQHGTWTVVPTSTIDPTIDDCHGIAFTATDEGWISCSAAILRYHQGQWSIASRVPGNQLAISAAGPNDIWVVGLNKGLHLGGTLLMHYDGTSWTNLDNDITRMSGPLTSVTMVSATEGWAIGSAPNTGDLNAHRDYLVHFHNGEWTLYQQQFAAYLAAVSMISATDGWAVGNHYSSGSNPQTVSVFLHYSNGTWNEYH